MKSTSLRKALALSSLLFVALPALSSCGASNYDVVLHVYNAEDYIDYGADAEAFDFYDEENDETYTFDNVLDGFEQYMYATTGKRVSVVYDAYDTNETMLSSLQTGRTSYDLICASDYTCQKMMGQGMLQKIDIAKEVPNYDAYASDYIKSVLGSIETEVDGKVESFGEYAVDYMWGTLGILYNPEKVASDKGMEEDEVKYAMHSYDALWDSRFQNEMSVKDSMRDTYAVGVMKHYEEQILSLMAEYDFFDEDLNLIEGSFEEAMETYNKRFTEEIFNRSDAATVEAVKKTLLELKENVFGFEVDSGKEDIVKGLVGMNLAWSGDAVFSMDQGDAIENNPVTLYYSVPETGGNIWFDTWVMMKECQGENREFALKFLDFLCHPDVAKANMSYIGYSTCIAGDSILDLLRSWYDPRTEWLYLYDDEEGDYAYDEDGNYIPNEGYENGDYLTVDGVDSWDGIAEEEEWDVVDLSYMFEGTLSEELLAEDLDEGGELGDTPSTNPYLFYTYELEEIILNEGTEEEVSTIVGRQFNAQYPDKNILPKLGIMADYGANNKYVLAMWEDVKSNNLPIAGVVVFAIVLGVMAFAIIYTIILRKRQHKVKVARRMKANPSRR